MTTPTLPEFLQARIAEDEARARSVLGVLPVEYSRTLAECESKRQVLGLLAADVADPRNAVRRDWAADILRGMATVYADHPDYQPEWRD